ncbi:hypothetical protein F5Y19DRAFT_84066 [Xylariaceae sp. FL1651]|nr:hypothetical protein F5Y19DRAFT_84066 [Xylariaceae sp. FL1651]
MRLSSSLALPATLLSLLLLPSSSLVGAISARSICVRENAPILAGAADCGNRNSLQECFLGVPDYVSLGDLERCFVDADCTIAVAALEARDIIKNCDGSSSAAELRRRGPEAMPAPTPQPVPQDSVTSQPTSPATTGLARPSVCSTARTIQTTVCPVTSLGPDKFSQLPCVSTAVASMECAATNYCFDDGTCVFRDDHIYPGGLVATIVLAIALVTGITTFLFFCIRDKREQKRARAEAEAEKLKVEQAAIQAMAYKQAMESQARHANPFADRRA